MPSQGATKNTESKEKTQLLANSSTTVARNGGEVEVSIKALLILVNGGRNAQLDMNTVRLDVNRYLWQKFMAAASLASSCVCWHSYS